MLIRLVLLLAFLPFGAHAQSLTKADLPNVSKGDVYVYQETDLRSGTKQRYTTRVTDVSDTTIVTQTGAARRVYTREWNLQETTRGGVVERTADPAWPYYSFPLEVGKRWNSRFVSISKEGNQTVRHEWAAVVEAVEQVTVPAGTFEVFRIRAESHHSGMREQKRVRGRMTITYWYAPDAGRHVRMEFQEDATAYLDQRLTELVSVKTAGKATGGE